MDGPYIEGKEHLGGFTIVETLPIDAALGWARRLTEITMLPVEVRPFHNTPTAPGGENHFCAVLKGNRDLAGLGAAPRSTRSSV